MISKRSQDNSEEGDTFNVQCHHIFTEAWKTLYCKQDLSDVTLIVGKERMEFKAHKLVLATHSDVMKRMLYRGSREGQEEVIPLPDADCSSFKSLLKYFYTGCVTMNKSFICQLIEMCDYYNVQELKRVCCKWLFQNLCVEDACKYLMFAALADEELHHDCLNWLDDHISDVKGTEGFMQLLSAQQLEEILARDSLDIHEIDLFQSLQNWVEYDRYERQDRGVALSKQIRLPMMTPTQLLGKVQLSGLVDTACIMKALTSLQPGAANPYAEESPAIVLRLPKIPEFPSDRLKWSIPLSQVTVKNPEATTTRVTFSKLNLATVEATGECNTGIALRTTEIKVPNFIRVQVVSKSSESYTDIKVGFEINKRTALHSCGIFSPGQQLIMTDQRHSFGILSPRQQQTGQQHYISGAVVSNSVATLGNSGASLGNFGLIPGLILTPGFRSSGLFSIPVGSVMYFSLHITGTSVCTQVNGSATAKANLGNASEEPNLKNTYTLLVQVTNPTDRMTIAIREDRSQCCNQ